MKKYLLLLFIIISVFKTSESKAQVNVQDSLGLVALYNRTSYYGWTNHTNWLTAAPVNSWYGVTVMNNRVVKLQLVQNNIYGSVPMELGNLNKLQQLDLSFNTFGGQLPDELNNLTELQILNLSYNSLHGTLSGGIFSNSDSLQILNLSHNNISGPLEIQFNNVHNLRELDLSYNSFTDFIPDNSINLPNLTYLNLSHNLLYFNITSSLANFSELETLILNNNKFSGNIPEELGKLKRLSTLDLSDNQLTGSIPDSLGQLSLLHELRLSDNKLSGTIPASIAQLPQLDILFLYDNYFTFSGLEAIATNYTFTLYAPQFNIPIHNINGILSVSAGGTLANDTFHWFKDNVLYKTIAGDSSLIPESTGSYSVYVTNSIVTNPVSVSTDLILYSDTISVGSLPLKLLSFTATKQNNNALLQWATAQEVSTSYFEVERSTDNLHFSDIGKVNAKGSAVANNYVFTDNTLSTFSHQSPTVYYRLKMFDKNGNYTLSEIRPIHISSVFTAMIYPNPVKDKLSISITASKDEAAQIEIISTEGKVLLNQTINLSAGTSTQNINVSTLTKGTYSVNIKTDEGVNEDKFVKE